MREINEILVYYIFKSLSPGCLPLFFFWVGLHYNVHQTVFPTNGLQQSGPAFLPPPPLHPACGLHFHNKLLVVSWEKGEGFQTSWVGKRGKIHLEATQSLPGERSHGVRSCVRSTQSRQPAAGNKSPLSGTWQRCFGDRKSILHAACWEALFHHGAWDCVAPSLMTNNAFIGAIWMLGPRSRLEFPTAL